MMVVLLTWPAAGLRPEDRVFSGDKAPIQPGNLSNLPLK